MSDKKNNLEEHDIKRKLNVAEDVPDESKKKMKPNDDDDDTNAVRRDEIDLFNSLDEYTDTISNSDYNSSENVENYSKERRLLQMKYPELGFNDFTIPENDYIILPRNKYNPYNTLTKFIGYTYNRDNSFLLDDGIFELMNIKKTNFSFWRDGLSIFMPRRSKWLEEQIQFIFKVTTCTAHKFKCTEEGDCKKSVAIVPSNEFSFFISGKLCVKNRHLESKKASFFAAYIYIDDCRKIKTPEHEIYQSISLPGSLERMNIFTIPESCDHSKACLIAPFDSIRPMCNNIKRKICKDLSSFDNRKCYLYGDSGIYGKMGSNGKVYLSASTLRTLNIYICVNDK